MTLRALKARDSTPNEPSLTVVGDVDSIRGLRSLVDTIGGRTSGGAATILHAVTEIARRTQSDEAMIAALMPADIPGEAHVAQLRRNAQARSEALREFGALTAAQLAAARGSTAANPHQTAGRWLAERRVFSVEGPRERLFPAFEFVGGRPKPGLRAILSALPRGLSGWEILGWFTGSSGNLGGARPVDLLDAEPERVAAAARYLSASLED